METANGKVTTRKHYPVMLREVLHFLNVREGATLVDGTVGHGGHAKAMLTAAGEKGTLVAMDWDETMLRKAEENLKDVPGRKFFVHTDFRMMPKVLEDLRISGVDGILLDFGVSIEHFEDVSRGFSFLADAPLDMRMNRSAKETAAAFLNRASQGEIERVLWEYGGERWANRIARVIVRKRKEGRMHRTQDLVDAVLEAIPPKYREKRIHPATRTFQAIRIAVNQELQDLQEAIVNAAFCLNPGGRMVTLSYHSGEDREAKLAFRKLTKEHGFRILTPRPLRPSNEEIRENPPSRSARLRAIERTIQPKQRNFKQKETP